MLYDWTTRVRRKLPKHVFRNAGDTLKLWPELNPDLRFSATYYDASISYPERLGVELVLDTKRLAPNSVALTNAELLPSGQQYAVHDRLSGEHIAVSARTIVNATGAWLDETLDTLNFEREDDDSFVSGTKGSHLILNCPALRDALGGHMIFFENADGRVCIVFPYLGKVLAGSTDIRVKAAERVRCEPHERDYILNALRLAFPRINVTMDNIVFSYSGIRPLPRSDHKFTGRISRGHYVHRVDGPIPQFCMVGGKWTTFRAFAEQTAEAVLSELGHQRVADTLGLPIGGGTGFPDDPAVLEKAFAAHYEISSERAAYLVDLYGTRAREILDFCAGRDDDFAISPGVLTTAAEIAFIAQTEHVSALADVLLRRTPLAIKGEVSLDIIEKTAATLATCFDWPEARTRQEIDSVVGELSDYYGVSAEVLKNRTIGRI
jgi:glycerol-3-phosphate dehydrogenase